ncbi:MAG: hypothetical protein ACPGSB_02520 [Opitutales bacterium]
MPGIIARTIKLCLCFALSAPCLPGEVSDVELQHIEKELSGIHTILLKSGNRQSGRILSFDEGSLRLAVQLGAGSAEMNFTADQIADISFPGNEYLLMLKEWMSEPDRTQDALALFRAFYKQRGPFLQYMEENELGLFVEYARYALDHGEALMAVSIINVLRPHISDETLLKSLDDAILLGFFRGGMREEAEKQAREWIEVADPAGASALGWSILAEIFFTQEQYEKAFWTALYPVAFANNMPTEHLESCYAFAIAAADELREEKVKLRLHKEMRQHNLVWPEKIPALAGLEPEPATTPESPETADDNQTAEAPPEESTPENSERATSDESDPAEPTQQPSSSLPTRLPQFTP